MPKLLLLIILILPVCLFAQQTPDTTYNPTIKQPAYPKGKGPIVFIDEGHHNFHTKDGRYKSFANLLERDGYQVKSYLGEFKADELSKGKILVISNALNEINVENWYLPNPSAFTKEEIKILKNWVQSGGSLFLIADHMPLAGAATDLASEFGFGFTNGFVMDTLSEGPAIFKRKDQSLVDNILTKGRNNKEKVKKVATFTGQAIKIPEDAIPILIIPDNYINFLPDTAWVFDEETPKYNVGGWAQGAFKQFGKGKVVVSGEAAMFSAQWQGPKKFKMGMNNKIASENYQLVLNIIHWLDGILTGEQK